MQNSFFVRCRQCIRDLPNQVGCPLQFNSTGLHNSPHAYAIYKIKHEIRMIVIHLAIVEDADYVWMVHSAERLGLLAKLLDYIFILESLFQQYLNHYRTSQHFEITGQIDSAHPTFAEVGFDQIT